MKATRLLVALCLLGPACASGADPGSGEIKVIVSAYPLAFLTEELVKGTAEVSNITPPGAEPHDLELTPGRIRDLAGADLVVYLGAGFQPSVEEAVAGLETETLDVLASQEDLRRAAEDGHDEHGEEESDLADEDAGAPIDPHVWLDPRRAAAMAHAIAARLEEVDRPHAETYAANAEALEERLLALDQEFRRGLARCRRDTIVTSHQAFGYLTEAYQLEEVGIAGIDPESEPSPARLAEVARMVQQEGVTTIYFEALVPPELAETLANETGAATAMLDPLEGPPREGDYFTAMESNLEALRTGLGCR